MIFCVEDDESIQSLELYTLRGAGFEVRGFMDGDSFLEALHTEKPELVILDVMLPGISGVELLKQMKASNDIRDIPVIMATAKGSEYDKIQSLDLGADDYLVKPFLPKELLLRVQAILKRAYPEKERVVTLNAASVDLDRAEVIRDGLRTPLTAKEYSVFEKLAENAGRIVTIGVLCQTLCGEIWQGYETTLMTHIRHLREKIEIDPANPRYLKVVWGLGYKMEKMT